MKIRIIIYSMIIMMGIITKLFVDTTYIFNHYFLNGMIFMSLVNILLEYLINRKNG
jgi:xanthine/uracil permease